MMAIEVLSIYHTRFYFYRTIQYFVNVVMDLFFILVLQPVMYTSNTYIAAKIIL